MLLMLLPIIAAAQPLAALKERLTKEMYRRYTIIDKKDEFMAVTDSLKDVCLKTDDNELFWRTWSNQATYIFRSDRERAIKIAKEMTAKAKADDDKFGLYVSTLTNAIHVSSLKMEDQAEGLFDEAIRYKERFLPKVNAAACYLGLAKIYVNRRNKAKVLELVEKALGQPGITKTQIVDALAYKCMGLNIAPVDLDEFNRCYAEMDKARNETKYNGLTSQTVDMYHAQNNKDFDRMLQFAQNLKTPQDRLSAIAHTYTWMGRWKDAYHTYVMYKRLCDSINGESVRKQSAEHSIALEAARAESEAKDLRLANQALELEQVAQELAQRHLQEEALNLSIENQRIELEKLDVELQNASMRQKNDSLDRYNKDLQISEYKSKLSAEESRKRTQRILLWSAIGIGLLILGFMVFYIYRRNKHAKEIDRHAKEIEDAYGKLETAHEKLEDAYGKLEETTAAKERMESELRIAREIQMGMVPRIFPAFPDRSDIDVYASLDSAKEVGGDLYDFFLQADHLYFCIGDVSGKGIPASLFMSVVVNLFRMVAKEGFPPEYVATKLNETLANDNDNGMFCTMFIGEIDLLTGRMNYCNAGHNPPLIIDRPLVPHEPCRPTFLEMEPNAPIGLWQDLEYVGESVSNVKGRTIFLYTDGLSEAENISQEQFGEDRLIEVFRTRPYDNAQQTIDIVNSTVTAFVGDAEQSDDLTMLCLKIL